MGKYPDWAEPLVSTGIQIQQYQSGIPEAHFSELQLLYPEREDNARL